MNGHVGVVHGRVAAYNPDQAVDRAWLSLVELSRGIWAIGTIELMIDGENLALDTRDFCFYDLSHMCKSRIV